MKPASAAAMSPAKRRAKTLAGNSARTITALLCTALLHSKTADASPPKRTKVITITECEVGPDDTQDCDDTSTNANTGDSDDITPPQHEDRTFLALQEEIYALESECASDLPTDEPSENRTTRAGGRQLESRAETLPSEKTQTLRFQIMEMYANCGLGNDALRVFKTIFDIKTLQDPTKHELDELANSAAETARSIGAQPLANSIEKARWDRIAHSDPIFATERILDILLEQAEWNRFTHRKLRTERITHAATYLQMAPHGNLASRKRVLNAGRIITRLALEDGLLPIAESVATRIQLIANEIALENTTLALSYVTEYGFLDSSSDERWAYVSGSRGAIKLSDSDGWRRSPTHSTQHGSEDTRTTSPEESVRNGGGGKRGRSNNHRNRAGSTTDSAPSASTGIPSVEENGNGGSSRVNVSTDASSSGIASDIRRETTYASEQDRVQSLQLKEAAAALAAAGATYYELGTLAQSMDRPDQAEVFYSKGREIDKILYDPRSDIFGLDLLAKGSLHLRRGRYDVAAETFREALLVLDRDRVEHDVAMENLAVALEASGEAAEALKIHAQMREQGERFSSLGEAAQIRRSMNYAAALRTAGRFADARSELESALDDSALFFGDDHPQTAEIQVHLVAVEAAAGRFEAASERLTRMLSSSNGALEMMLRVGSEADKLSFLQDRWRETSIAVTLALNPKSQSQRVIMLASEFALNRKGRIAEATTQQVGDVSRLGARGAALLSELKALRREVAEDALDGSGSDHTDEGQAERLRVLEADLSRAAPEIGDARKIEEVAAVLRDGEVYVEYVRYRPMRAEMPRQADRWGPPAYAVFMVQSSGAVTVHDLGPAQVIDDAALALRRSLATRGEYKRVARGLHQKVWEPIEPNIGSARRVYLVPESALSLIPFEALVDASGEHLVESRVFDYLATGRDLFQRSATPAKKDRLIYAAVDFGVSSMTRSDALASVEFKPLPGTAREAESIRSSFPEAIIVSGAEATKSSLFSLDSPETLHIATHGFFFGADPDATPEASRALEFTSVAPVRRLSYPDNPLVRTGIALFGANVDAVDGVLTALEVSNLDLHGTKLVTLSACETGLGDVTDGEGVQGMRRSLGIAGAETVVLSLWKVDDAATATLMGDYYSRLARGEGRVDALRASALVLASRPETAHPYYWAAFIASGDPRSLSGEPVPPPDHFVDGRNGPPQHRACSVASGRGDIDFSVTLILGLIFAARRRRSSTYPFKRRPLLRHRSAGCVETNIHKGWDENAAWLRKVVPTL